jgi:hypothetical protein
MLKRPEVAADTHAMHTILWLAKRLGIGQQHVGGVGLLLVVTVVIPGILLLAVKLYAG